MLAVGCGIGVFRGLPAVRGGMASGSRSLIQRQRCYSVGREPSSADTRRWCVRGARKIGGNGRTPERDKQTP